MIQTDDPDIVFKYFREYLDRGFRKIFNEQRSIAAAKIYGRQAYRTDGTRRSRSGQLEQALTSPQYSLSGLGSSAGVTVSYPTYLRFLDMKRLGNYRIYNRPIWGILYKETLKDIKYEFRDWLSDYVRRQLSNSFKP